MEQQQNERMRILELVAQGKLSVTEAELLLRSLAGEDVPPEAPPKAEAASETNAKPGPEHARRPRRMRIQVSDMATNRTRVNLVLPMGLVKAGLRLGAALKPWTWGEGDDAEGAKRSRPPEEVMAHLGEDLEALYALFDEAEIGPLVDVYDEEDGEHVLIALE